MDTPNNPLKGPEPQGSPTAANWKEPVINEISQIYDPEIPVNIYELGLIYDLSIDEGKCVHVRMTLTAPACPVAGELVKQVERRVAALPGISAAKVELVWDPPWSPEKMSEAAKLELGMM